MVVAGAVTMVMPIHPARWRTTARRALRSVLAQSEPVAAMSIATDTERAGAGPTRDRAMAAVKTEWIAFLDSDDEWHIDHVKRLVAHAAETGADVVYPACRVVHTELGVLPRDHPGFEEWGRPGKPFDAELLRRKSYLPVTSLVRTSLAQKSSFVPPGGSHYDDWGFYLGLLDLGATFVHLPWISWTWMHGPQNTSGRPDRGDAR
jgi:glycosyltransferase involved in cell wall biosynthesis